MRRFYEPPITTSIVAQQLGNDREWKAQTTISLLLRLVERGFLRTEKNGKERTFFPLVEKRAVPMGKRAEGAAWKIL